MNKINIIDVLKYYPFDIVPNSVDGCDTLNVTATNLLFYCPLRNKSNYKK